MGLKQLKQKMLKMCLENLLEKGGKRPAEMGQRLIVFRYISGTFRMGGVVG